MVSGREEAHSTPSLRGLSYRFAVRTDDERLGHLVDAVLGGLRDPGDGAPVEHWYSLTPSAAPAPSTSGATAWRSRAGSPTATPWDGSCGT